MSDKNIVEKATDIMGNVTKFEKQSKLRQAYQERDEFEIQISMKVTSVITA